MTTGWPGLLEHGQRRRICRGRRTDYGTTGRTDQRKPPSCLHSRPFPGTTGLAGAADAAVDSAGAAVPSEELRAGRIRRMAMLEYTAASGRLDHATFRERADASVRCSPSFYTPIDRQGMGLVEMTFSGFLFMSR